MNVISCYAMAVGLQITSRLITDYIMSDY